MTDDLELAEETGRLIACGLRATRRPSGDPAYRELLVRYRSDVRFRAHVDAVARGLGLRVLGAIDHGLVLGAEDDGVFAARLEDYRRKKPTVEERMCHGLVQLAIAAWCFPTAEHLEDRDSVVGARLTVARLVTYLVDMCRELEGRRERIDPSLEHHELAPAWRGILDRAETRATQDGRRAPGTLAGIVALALDNLADSGLVRRVSEEDGGTFQALGAYRLQVRELAALDAFQLVRGLAPGAG